MEARKPQLGNDCSGTSEKCLAYCERVILSKTNKQKPHEAFLEGLRDASPWQFKGEENPIFLLEHITAADRDGG